MAVGATEITQKRSPASSPQQSRSTTPAPFNRQGPALGDRETATTADRFNLVLPSDAESASKRVDNGEDVLKGGETDEPDTVQSMPVRGGTGGPGGQGGSQGDAGGTGEGNRFTIHHSNVNLTNPGATELHSIKDKLASHVAAQHKFTDQSKSLCAPGTHVEIQANILEWLSPQPGTKECIFWITEKIIPTIALQLAEFSPVAAGIIHNVLEHGFPATRKKQVEELVLAPVRELCKSCDVVVILIDALDKLQNAAKSVLEILSPIAPRACDLPINVRFLITSRPEHWADISKSETLELAVFKQHALETESSVNEVHKFIVAIMKKIIPDEPGWDNWPPSGKVRQLSNKANGLFHYAATALHWIENQIEGKQNARQHEVRLASFQHVIGTILVLYKPLTIRQIIALLDDIEVDNLDVPSFLQKQMCSVLIPGMTRSFEEATPQMHKAFRDYIIDGHAPKEFCILTGHAHFVTARSCLEVIIKAGSQSDVAVEYSVQLHLQKAVEGGMPCEDERMWNLFGKIVEEVKISIWVSTDVIDVFVDVATVGESAGNFKDIEESKSYWRESARNFKDIEESKSAYVPSMLIKIWSLGGRSACFSPIAHVCPPTISHPLPIQIPYRKIWDEGLLETWESHHSSLLHAQDEEMDIFDHQFLMLDLT
ncbi:hypothetical protein B0H13DRAFT_1897703 [Mycena leptocephala]|nr:hypothetical protein B0H13DRAFT_1897703 [Mycena leptocephala]